MNEQERAQIKTVVDQLAAVSTGAATLGKLMEEAATSLAKLAAAVDTPTTPAPGKITVSATRTASTITLTWPKVAGATSYATSRGGKDITGAGAWTIHSAIPSVTFDKLIPGTSYLIGVDAVDAEGDTLAEGNITVATPAASTPPVTVPPVTTPPVTTAGTWSTGVWTNHDKATAEAWFARTGRAATKTGSHVCCFVTHENATEAIILQNWWAASVPAGRGLSLRVPLVPEADANFSTDRTAMWKKIAEQATAVDERALICPGWEFNLPGWAHAITPANQSAWIQAFKRAYFAMKSVNPKLVIGINPNGGDNGQTGVAVDWVYGQLKGYFDALGPDQYDCYPPFNSAGNIATQSGKAGGLLWHMNQAKQYDVPLIVPEWGVSSGYQWAGNAGGDNPLYIQQMKAFFEGASKTGKGLLAETYFNDPADYLKSALFSASGPTQNTKAAAAYLAAWKGLPAK